MKPSKMQKGRLYKVKKTSGSGIGATLVGRGEHQFSSPAKWSDGHVVLPNQALLLYAGTMKSTFVRSLSDTFEKDVYVFLFEDKVVRLFRKQLRQIQSI